MPKSVARAAEAVRVRANSNDENRNFMEQLLSPGRGCKLRAGGVRRDTDA